MVFYQFLFECFIRIQLFASVDQKHIPRTHLVGVNQVAINELLNDVVRFYIECILLSSFLQSLDADLDLLLIHISQVDGVNDSVGSQNCFFLDLLSVVVENEPFRGDVQLGGYHFSKLVSPHLLGKFDAFRFLVKSSDEDLDEVFSWCALCVHILSEILDEKINFYYLTLAYKECQRSSCTKLGCLKIDENRSQHPSHSQMGLAL